MRFIFFRFCHLYCNEIYFHIVCQKSNTMMPFSSPENWKLMTVLLRINDGSSISYILKVFERQSEDRIKLMKTRYPVHIMMFGLVTSDGNLVSAFIFAYGSRLNTEVFIKCLEEVVLSLSDRVAVTGLWTMPSKYENPLLDENISAATSPITFHCFTCKL